MMVVGTMGVALAATGDHLTTAENTISATGLESGDTLTAYQLVKWENGDCAYRLRKCYWFYFGKLD